MWRGGKALWRMVADNNDNNGSQTFFVNKIVSKFVEYVVAVVGGEGGALSPSLIIMIISKQRASFPKALYMCVTSMTSGGESDAVWRICEEERGVCAIYLLG